MDETDTPVMDITGYRVALLHWGIQHARVFPWRMTTQPYSLLVAEVMLHRTQASQVSTVFQRFMMQYPTLADAAKAGKADLQALLYPLGLHWRIDLLSEMIADIVERFDGYVPLEKDSLLSLPGVSDYIASAVRCFSQNMLEPLVDTNTVRVIGRLYNIPIKDSSRRNAQIRRLIAELVDNTNPAVYNYALLDLAALICTKVREPDCPSCPVLKYCRYGQSR